MKTTAILLGILDLSQQTQMYNGLPVGTECFKASSLKFYHDTKNNAKNIKCDSTTRYEKANTYADYYYGSNINKQGCWSNNYNGKITRYSVDCSTDGKIYIKTYVNTAECSGSQSEESPFAWPVSKSGVADCESWPVLTGDVDSNGD